MATQVYKVKAPDGQIIQLRGPVGASKDEVIAKAQELYSSSATQEKQRLLAMPYSEMVGGLVPASEFDMASGAQVTTPTEPMQLGTGGQIARGLIKGAVVDPLAGIAQLVGGSETRQRLAEYEQSYQQMRKREGADGIEWSRLVGNVLTSIVPGAAAARGAQLLGAGRITTGVAGGVGGASTLPVTQTPEEANDPNTFALQKLRDVGFSGAAGGVIAKLSAALAPTLKEGVKEQLEAGVKVPPGLAYEGIPGWVFRQMESIGFGPSEKAIRDSFTKSAADEVLSSIGKTVPKTMKSGMQMSAYVQKAISQYYDDAFEKLGKVVPDNQFADDLRTVIADNLEGMSPRAKKIFTNDIQKELIDRFKLGPVPKGAVAPQGMKQLPSMEGTELKSVNNFLKDKIEKLGKKTGDDAERLAAGYEDLLNSFRSYTSRIDTEGLLSNADEAWAKLYRFADAASSSKAAGTFKGSFSAGELERSATRQATALQAGAGAGPMGQFTRKGVGVFGEEPDVLRAGYRQAIATGKGLTALGVAGGSVYLFNPALVLPVLVASGLSYKAAQQLMKNPSATRTAVQRAIEKLGPQAVGAIVAREEAKVGQVLP
jgi:hypothetical protein